MADPNQENVQPRANTASVVTRSELQNIRATLNTQGGKKRGDVAVISKNELDRIRKEVLIKEKDQVAEEMKLMTQQREKQRQMAETKKQRMQDRDRLHAATAPLEVKAKNFGENTLLAGAQEKMDEDYDDVKHFNQKVLFSKVATIRDRQINENTHLEQNWVEEQKRLDMMMEIERLKAIRAEQEKEERGAVARMNGKQVLVDQIKARQDQRMREEELLEREKAQMLANIQRMKREDEADKKAKLERVKIMSDEIRIANQQALQQKEAAREVEKQLDREIAEHTRKKQEREEAKIREDQRIKEEKEREIQRLRDLQERANDRQAELDQIRAQKAYEAAELKRRAELAIKEKKHNEALAELHEARQRQFAMNDERMRKEAAVDRELHMKVVQKQRADEEKERREMQQRRGLFLDYKGQLNKQMSKNEALRIDGKHQQIMDAKRTSLLIDQERNRIEMIKAQKLSTVKDLGVTEKYQYDLLKQKPSF